MTVLFTTHGMEKGPGWGLLSCCQTGSSACSLAGGRSSGFGLGGLLVGLLLMMLLGRRRSGGIGSGRCVSSKSANGKHGSDQGSKQFFHGSQDRVVSGW